MAVKGGIAFFYSGLVIPDLIRDPFLRFLKFSRKCFQASPDPRFENEPWTGSTILSSTTNFSRKVGKSLPESEHTIRRRPHKPHPLSAAERWRMFPCTRSATDSGCPAHGRNLLKNKTHNALVFKLYFCQNQGKCGCEGSCVPESDRKTRSVRGLCPKFQPVSFRGRRDF